MHALKKMLFNVFMLPTANIAVIVQLHQTLGSTSEQQPNWLWSEINAVIASAESPAHNKVLRVEELPVVHTPIQAGTLYICEPGNVSSITQIGEIKRVRSDFANSGGITTLFSELSVLQSHALVVQSVGVVLSGMQGNDGVEGAKELHMSGGIIVVQEMSTCEFPDMPASVRAAVPESVLCTPESICETIANLSEVHGAPVELSEQSRTLEQAALMREICATVLRERGCDFRLYHSNMVYRRISHCMHQARVATLAEYAERLRSEPMLVEALLNKLLINVTSFFRDAETWDVISTEVIPAVFLNAQSFELRFWCARVPWDTRMPFADLLLCTPYARVAMRPDAPEVPVPVRVLQLTAYSSWLARSCPRAQGRGLLHR